MKSLILSAILLVASTVAFGQVGHSPTANTGANVATVNIILHDVQSVVVNPSQKTIDLVYDSQEDYENGVSNLQSNHLSAFSTQDYIVTSAVWQENLITQEDIYLNGILQNRQFKPLFQDNKGSRTYDVEYSAKGNNEYLDKNKTTYTTQVIYTISPQ